MNNLIYKIKIGSVLVDFEYFLKLIKILFDGTLVSLKIFGITLLLSIPLGFLVSLGKLSKHKIISCPVNIYILIMRGTPLILQIIFIYFAPSYIFKVPNDRFIAVIFAFTINYAAYFGEIFRGGIQSMPVGQYEASEILGFTKLQTFFHIILPQVIKRILPATGNEVITLIKDTALAQVIGVTELFALAQKQSSNKFSVIPLFVAGIFYFVLNWGLSTVFARIEKKFNYYK